MDFDFALLLVVLTGVTGVIWLFDRLFLQRGRHARAEALAAAGGSEAERQQRMVEAAREPVIVEYARSFFPVILIVLLFRSFLAEPFKIPSGSMMPTLLVGDFTRPLTTDWAENISDPLLRDDLKLCFAGNPQERFAGAEFADRPVHDLGRRGAPIIHFDAGLFIKRITDGFAGVRVQGAVNNCFAFLLCRFDQFGILSVRRRRRKKHYSCGEY